MVQPHQLAALRQTAAEWAPTLLAEIDRIGPFVIAPGRYQTVADHLYVGIVNQQLSSKAADTIWARVVALAGDAPVSSLFCDARHGDLRACGVSGNKARALAAVRQADLAGILDRVRLAALGHEERVEVLTGIKGIGRWTADMVGIFYFQEPDIWPEGDVTARTMLRRLGGTEDSVAMAARFAPHRSILARYLWRIRDQP